MSKRERQQQLEQHQAKAQENNSTINTTTSAVNTSLSTNSVDADDNGYFYDLNAKPSAPVAFFSYERLYGIKDKGRQPHLVRVALCQRRIRLVSGQSSDSAGFDVFRLDIFGMPILEVLPSR